MKNTKNFLWCKISREMLNSEKYDCGTYIPPEKNKYYDDDEIFELFENDLINFSSKANVLVLGDLARTSKLEDFVSNEG